MRVSASASERDGQRSRMRKVCSTEGPSSISTDEWMTRSPPGRTTENRPPRPACSAEMRIDTCVGLLDVDMRSGEPQGGHEPAGQEVTGTEVPRHLDAGDVIEERPGGVPLEQASQQTTPRGEAHPRQVGDRQAPEQAGHLGECVGPVADRPRVDDDAVRGLEQRVAQGGEVAGQPDRDGQVGQGERLDQRVEVPAGGTAHAEHDVLEADRSARRRAGCAPRHVGVDAGIIVGVVSTTRTSVREGWRRPELADDLDGALGDARVVHHGDERHHTRAHRGALLVAAQLGERVGDLRDRDAARPPMIPSVVIGGVRRIGRGHGLRHRRPSRASSSSASGGPQLPAS